eukprot:366415-Chlamydomonas_euryale.AAC.11
MQGINGAHKSATAARSPIHMQQVAIGRASFTIIHIYMFVFICPSHEQDAAASQGQQQTRGLSAVRSIHTWRIWAAWQHVDVSMGSLGAPATEPYSKRNRRAQCTPARSRPSCPTSPPTTMNSICFLRTAPAAGRTPAGPQCWSARRRRRVCRRLECCSAPAARCSPWACMAQTAVCGRACPAAM